MAMFAPHLNDSYCRSHVRFFGLQCIPWVCAAGMCPFRSSFVQFCAFFSLWCSSVADRPTANFSVMGWHRQGLHRHKMGKNHLQLEDKALGQARSSCPSSNGKKKYQCWGLTFGSSGLTEFASVKYQKWQVLEWRSLGCSISISVVYRYSERLI